MDPVNFPNEKQTKGQDMRFSRTAGEHEAEGWI
jgi:hypothetical protein